ncbi:MAG TPA: ABC transporter permease [Burkholderiales bacterium]|nr:ABC transporter permease [Burkholderiales bacterium]
MQSILLDFSLAARNILRQRRRSIISICAVAFGITALILATGFIEHIFLIFREATIKSQLGHLQIVKPGFHDAGKANPYAFLLPDELPALGTATESRTIKTIAPRISFSGLISHGTSTISFIGEGVSPSDEAEFGDALQISSGNNLSASLPRTVIIGVGLARNLGVKVGDTVVLLSNTTSGGTNAVEVTVRGLFHSVSKAYDDAALRLPLVTTRELLRTKGSHVWMVLLNDTSQTDTVLAQLKNKLPKDQFETVPWYKLSDFYNKTAELFTKQIQGLRLIIALIILLCISNTMIMSVLERTGEIGTAMALGIKRSGILRLFLSEGILLGCIGGTIGILVGVTLAQIITVIGIPMPAPPGKSEGYLGGVLINGSMCVQAFAIAVTTTLVASIYPAWRASRMEIVDSLRRNR